MECLETEALGAGDETSTAELPDFFEQQFLYLKPLPQGQGELRPIFIT